MRQTVFSIIASTTMFISAYSIAEGKPPALVAPAVSSSTLPTASAPRVPAAAEVESAPSDESKTTEGADAEKKIIPVEPPTAGSNSLVPFIDSTAAELDPKYVTEEEIINTKTLMFKPGDHDKIIKMFNGYRINSRNRGPDKITSGQTDDLLSDVLSKIGEQGADKSPKLPAYFYLNSIIYEKGNHPRIWINGTKMEIGDVADGLTFNSATKETAKFTWKVPFGGDLNEWNRRTEDKNNKSEAKIEVAISGGEVRFALKTNQFFDVVHTKIVEGRTMDRLGINDADRYFFDPIKRKMAVTIPQAPKSKPNTPPAGQKSNQPPTPAPVVAQEVDIKESFPIGVDKHYTVFGEVGGKKEVFKVDTGATITALPLSVAKNLGIDTEQLVYDQEVGTAGGKIQVAKASLPELRVGKLSVKNLEVSVFDDKNLNVPLLGQNFLNQFDSETKNGVLTLSVPKKK